MPSPKFRKLQDESAAVEKEIFDLRSVEPKDDEERSRIEGRLAELGKRAAEIATEGESERELDAKVAAMRAIREADKSREDVEAGASGKDGARSTRRVPFAGGNRSFYSSEEAKEGVGVALRSLARGEINMTQTRDAMGSTSPTYDGAGAEFITEELSATVLNVIDYTSVIASLAMPAEVKGNTLKLPSAGEITCDFVDENSEPTDQVLSTSADPLVIYDLRAWLPVSNNTLEDSPVTVANLIERKGFTAFGKKLDHVYLNGHTGKGIEGLLALVAGSDREFDLEGGAITAGIVGELVGSVEDMLNDPVWLVSSEGWGKLIGLYGSQLGNGVVGNGRPTKTILGDPIIKVKGLPPGTLAVYGDFGSSSAFGYKPRGLTITALRELGRKKNQTIFDMIQRVGVLNHSPEFVAVLKDTGT